MIEESDMFRKLTKLAEQSLHKERVLQRFEQPKLTDLFWETTLNCNAHCKHCGSNASMCARTDELITEEIRDTFTMIARDMDASEIFIHVTGGEPLLRNDVFEVMTAASELGFTWGMTSNGMLFDDSLILKAEKAGMSTIAISIDGLETCHDTFRGVKGSYQSVLTNIMKLRDARFLKHLQVITVVHKYNLSELEELYHVMCTLGIDSWRLTSVDPIGRALHNQHLLLDGAEHRLMMDFIKKKRRTKGLLITYGCSSYLGLQYEKEVRNHFFSCRTGISIASILYNGDISVCPNVPRHPSYIQGNIKYDSFVAVWEQQFSIFREQDRTISDTCRQCEELEHCFGGSFHTWDMIQQKQTKCIYELMNSV